MNFFFHSKYKKLLDLRKTIGGGFLIFFLSFLLISNRSSSQDYQIPNNPGIYFQEQYPANLGTLGTNHQVQRKTEITQQQSSFTNQTRYLNQELQIPQNQSYIPVSSSLPEVPSGQIVQQTMTVSPKETRFDPNDPVQQALSLHQSGRYADAIQIYESIILNNPPDPRVYASIADAHFKLGNSDRSLKYAIESLKLDPNYSSGHLLLGTILASKGDIIRAVRSFERVIKLDQHNPYAYYNLGLLYYQKANIRSAIQYFERAKDFNPKDPKIWNNLGVAYYDNSRYDEARTCFERSLELDPAYLTAKDNLANLDQSVNPFRRTMKKLSELFPNKEIVSSHRKPLSQ